MVENPSTTTKDRKRRPRSERRREPAVNRSPSRPGNRAAYKNCGVPEGRSAAELGSVVVMWKLTWDVAATCGGAVQVDCGAGSEAGQAKVTGPLKPPFIVTVNVASMLEPCATWKLPADGVRVNAFGKVADR